jgi:hypothetical protein
MKSWRQNVLKKHKIKQIQKNIYVSSKFFTSSVNKMFNTNHCHYFMMIMMIMRMIHQLIVK